ncbi:hypothetical protein F3Y22_tig00112215pilonHSYRG00118 [Hibiscus syriacus]|uniref:Uncharacterized protein n=1 Tax=Hibiscus syriacus TaxID=106335 RepID=A0A6A2YBH0_HIBSY|nr:hypothetical protein F3Y22_tig00112215pilonHSYRG00118 [Hibiscus syriacus]
MEGHMNFGLCTSTIENNWMIDWLPMRLLFQHFAVMLLPLKRMKLPDAVVRRLELEKELLPVEWPYVHLGNDEKKKALHLLEMVVSYVDSYINIGSFRSETGIKSAQVFALNHVKCLFAFGSADCSRSMFEKYRKVYPSCLELVLISVRVPNYDSKNMGFIGFEESLHNWPKESPGIHCIYMSCTREKAEKKKLDSKKSHHSWQSTLENAKKNQTMPENPDLSAIRKQLEDLTTLMKQSQDETNPPKWWKKQESRLSTLESKLETNQRYVEQILHILNDKKSEQKQINGDYFTQLQEQQIHGEKGMGQLSLGESKPIFLTPKRMLSVAIEGTYNVSQMFDKMSASVASVVFPSITSTIKANSRLQPNVSLVRYTKLISRENRLQQNVSLVGYTNLISRENQELPMSVQVATFQPFVVDLSRLLEGETNGYKLTKTDCGGKGKRVDCRSKEKNEKVVSGRVTRSRSSTQPSMSMSGFSGIGNTSTISKQDERGQCRSKARSEDVFTRSRSYVQSPKFENSSTGAEKSSTVAKQDNIVLTESIKKSGLEHVVVVELLQYVKPIAGELRLSESIEIFFLKLQMVEMLALIGKEIEGGELNIVEVIPKVETQQWVWGKYKKDVGYKFGSTEVGHNGNLLPIHDPCLAIGFLPLYSVGLRVGQLVTLKRRNESPKDIGRTKFHKTIMGCSHTSLMSRFPSFDPWGQGSTRGGGNVMHEREGREEEVRLEESNLGITKEGLGIESKSIGKFRDWMKEESGRGKQNGKPDLAKNVMTCWYNSVWKVQYPESENLKAMDGGNSIVSPETDSTLKSHVVLPDTNQTDMMFGYLNLFLYNFLQNDNIEAHSAIDQALRVATTPMSFNHCVNEHALFLLNDESQKSDVPISWQINTLNMYLEIARSFQVCEPLSRHFITVIEKPRVQQLVRNILCPVSSDSSLVNLVLEVWYGPSLLPQNLTQPKGLVDFVEAILALAPSNYELMFSVCKMLSRGDHSRDVSSGLLFWAGSTLVDAFFHAVSIPPELAWVNTADIMDNIPGMEAVLARFYRKALTAYPFSLKLWLCYYNLISKIGDRNIVVEAARERGTKLE